MSNSVDDLIKDIQEILVGEDEPNQADWLDLVERSVEELESQQNIIKQNCLDWAETDTTIKEMLKPYLSQEEINGDGYAFQTIETVIEILINKYLKDKVNG